MSIRSRSDVWLFAHQSMESLANSIADRCQDDTFKLSDESTAKRQEYVRQLSEHRSTTKRSLELKTTIQWKKFPDGFPNLFIEDVKQMAGKDVLFLASFHTPEVIFQQLSVLYAIPKYLARSFTVILPYFPTGTMERVDTEGQIATAKTLATILSAIPMTSRGPAQIMVFDIHALQERFYFSETVIPRLETAIPLLHREVSTRPEINGNIAYAFPDDGAFKRFHHFFPESQTIICTKIRDGNKRIVKIKDGPDPAGLNVIIIDDLIQTGGTMKNCGKAVLDRGAKSVSAFVTHAVFPNESWKRFTTESNTGADAVKFDNFWITDSIPHAAEISKHPPFKLLSLGDVIADILLGYDLLR
ncbi:uncharacterized protein LOC141909723 [Tubulanus polymorphus]|uniref:uncharacterized protein LOC141909723 n=1 Tax=Tubulanus polymorphus TaxID=672921 RepID=UPI003DA260C8